MTLVYLTIYKKIHSGVKVCYTSDSSSNAIEFHEALAEAFV